LWVGYGQDSRVRVSDSLKKTAGFCPTGSRSGYSNVLVLFSILFTFVSNADI